jgi:hypothetical protein
MTVVLLLTCIMTPLDIAFSPDIPESVFDNPLTFTIDLLFFLDICIIFNTSFYTIDMELIQDRRSIANNYLRGWFMIDALAIVPFDVILNSGQASLQNSPEKFNQLARVARIGRLYKLVKLTRLLRILKIVKDKNKFLKYLTEWLKIGLGFERLFFFIIIFLLGMHLSACFWLITASFMATEILDADGDSAGQSFEGTWLEAYAVNSTAAESSDMYAVAIYWSVQTVTTVGYGDVGS